MKIFDILGLAIGDILILSLIDRWCFRKIVILSRDKMDGEKFRVTTKTHSYSI